MEWIILYSVQESITTYWTVTSIMVHNTFPDPCQYTVLKHVCIISLYSACLPYLFIFLVMREINLAIFSRWHMGQLFAPKMIEKTLRAPLRAERYSPPCVSFRVFLCRSNACRPSTRFSRCGVYQLQSSIIQTTAGITQQSFCQWTLRSLQDDDKPSHTGSESSNSLFKHQDDSCQGTDKTVFYSRDTEVLLHVSVRDLVQEFKSAVGEKVMTYCSLFVK